MISDHGSFTGIRIGVSTAKALAVVNDIPIVGVSSLEALSYNVNDKKNGTICSLIDANNSQVYCGIFDSSHNQLQDYLADNINSILANISYTDVSFVGSGAINYLNNTIYNGNLSAYNVGIAGYKKYLAGVYENADLIVPLYLRVSQAERMKHFDNPNNKNVN